MRYSIAAVVIATVLTTSTDTTPGPQTQLATVTPVLRVSDEVGPKEPVAGSLDGRTVSAENRDPVLDPLEAPV